MYSLYRRQIEMKTTSVILSLAVVLFVTLEAGCQEQQKVTSPGAAVAVPAAPEAPASPAAPAAEKPEAKKAEPGPVITFETTEHDFGNVGPGSAHTFHYKFKNTGDAMLTISNVQSTCSCTVPALEKKDYAPGEEGQIEVTYTAIASTVPVTKHISVFSNDKSKPNSEVQLTLKALSVPKVKITPANFQLSLIDKNAGMPELTLTASDGVAFSIKGITSTGGAITASFDPNAKASTFTLKPTVDIAKLRENNNGLLTIELTHPDCSAVEARYIAKAEFESQPAIIYLPGAEVGKTVQKELWVVSNYDKDFTIDTVASEKGLIKLASQEKQGNKYLLTIDITPTAPADAVKFFTDSVIVKIKDGPSLKVRCNMWFKSAGGEATK
jgi:hypothetical protein